MLLTFWASGLDVQLCCHVEIVAKWSYKDCRDKNLLINAWNDFPCRRTQKYPSLEVTYFKEKYSFIVSKNKKIKIKKSWTYRMSWELVMLLKSVQCLNYAILNCMPNLFLIIEKKKKDFYFIWAHWSGTLLPSYINMSFNSLREKSC